MKDLKEALHIKNKLKQFIEKGNIELAQEYLQKYENINSFDMELNTIKSILYFINGDYEKAKSKLLNMYNKYEFNFEVNYNLGIINFNQGNWEKSLEYFIRAMVCDPNKKELALNEIANISSMNIDKNKFNQIKEETLLKFNDINKTFPMKSNNENYIGKFLKNIKFEKYIVGLYDYYFLQRDGLYIEENNSLLNFLKSEVVPANKINKTSFRTKNKVLLPLMILNGNDKINISIDNEEKTLKDLLPNRIYYYPIEKNKIVSITSSTDFILGDIIEFKIDKNKPKLILNVFIDGLSQKFLKENGFEEFMPNAYKFFKEGTVCKNSYVTGEWTYVSMASFFTGKYTANHRVYHPQFSTDNLYDQELFTEILNKENYFVGKIDGDWRSTPASGYIKGTNRIIYQPSVRGMHTDEVILESIEHLEAFKEKNNFLWICLPDLHDVADEYETRISTQVNNPIDTRIFDKTEESSVRKKYDEKKIHKYGTQLKRIDTYLGLLLNYIKDNYKDDEYIVSLIADHGQGYLVNSGEFLDEGRNKVAMMFRGKNIPKGSCNELIEGLDLFPIILNAAEVKDFDLKDGNIPKYFGGEKEREYTYTESIFPDSPYRAAINDLTHKFFFETKENCTVDGRVKAYEYKVKLVNKETDKDETQQHREKVEKYTEIVFDHIKEYIIIE